LQLKGLATRLADDPFALPLAPLFHTADFGLRALDFKERFRFVHKVPGARIAESFLKVWSAPTEMHLSQ
jgi:hypothetical protein